MRKSVRLYNSKKGLLVPKMIGATYLYVVFGMQCPHYIFNAQKKKSQPLCTGGMDLSRRQIWTQIPTLPYAMHVTSALIPSLENVESNMGTDNEIHTRAIMRADEIAG